MDWYNIAILVVIAVVITAILYFKNRSLEQIKKDVYDLFIDAEHSFEKEAGKQKMKWVVSEVRLLLPKCIQLFVSEQMLEAILEKWFQAIKKLLHDGQEKAVEDKTAGSEVS